MFKNILVILFFLILGNFQQIAFAGAHVVPIKIVDAAAPIVTQEIIYWTEDDSALNPCYGASECWVGPDVLYATHAPGLFGSCLWYRNCIEISELRYAWQVMEKFEQSKGIPYTATFDIRREEATCVGLFYIPRRLFVGGGDDGILWPNSTCGKIPPADQFCDLWIPNEIDHGKLRNKELDGDEMETSGTLTCLKEGTMKLYVTSNHGTKNIELSFDGTLYSNLSLDTGGGYKDGWGGVSIFANGNEIPTDFNIKSTLRSIGKIEPGLYEGTALITAVYD
ncbi:MrpH family fimbial adhesin [Providencia manganoxydans]|uniref:MrpH family fimbial adhesin n=1 Tax=Providencia manganoxydans TaxID=2923283 RepID=UPI0032DAA899